MHRSVFRQVPAYLKARFPNQSVLFLGDYDVEAEENYIKNFRVILKAIKEEKPIRISMKTRKGKSIVTVAIPKKLEYSPKDDKFRVYTFGSSQVDILNVRNIMDCEIYEKEYTPFKRRNRIQEKMVKIELYDQRNALERFMLHFAHFKKTAMKICGNKYHINVFYESIDETELIIRILSFGQFVKVISPDDFIKQIRYRINKQNLLFNQNKKC
jgi:predicted DNA-binding transcriptional regulator YafY